MAYSRNTCAALLCVVVGGGWFASTAEAQYSSSSAASVRSATRNYLYNRPTVSPYLNLTSRDSSIGLPNYHTLVRPQIENQQRDVMRQQQTQQIQRQLGEIQSQFRQSQQEKTGLLMTGRYGWSSRGYPRFGTYLNFFPGFQRIARRQ